MDFYSRHVFPRLCDRFMGLPVLAELRKDALADVGGDVLEVGFGTGLNLAHYPEHVRRITTVDPNPGMNKLAAKRIASSGIEVDQRASGGESLPFEDERS
jgi:ubiquinone/menaquinone biosynthesis C-methylase UbiE